MEKFNVLKPIVYDGKPAGAGRHDPGVPGAGAPRTGEGVRGACEGDGGAEAVVTVRRVICATLWDGVAVLRELPGRLPIRARRRWRALRTISWRAA